MQVSPSELEVLKALWADAPRTAAEVAAEVAPGQGWSDRTVKTLLSRLVEKGAVAADAEGRRYLYRPLIEEDAYRSRAAGQFIDRVFGGRTAPLVAHLADTRGLSPEDVAELRALLKELGDDE